MLKSFRRKQQRDALSDANEHLRQVLLQQAPEFEFANVSLMDSTPAALLWLIYANDFAPHEVQILMNAPHRPFGLASSIIPFSSLETLLPDLASLGTTFTDMEAGLTRWPSATMGRMRPETLNEADILMDLLANQFIHGGFIVPEQIYWISLLREFNESDKTKYPTMPSGQIYFSEEFRSHLLSLAIPNPSVTSRYLFLQEQLRHNFAIQGMRDLPEHMLDIWETILSEIHAPWNTSNSIQQEYLRRKLGPDSSEAELVTLMSLLAAEPELSINEMVAALV